MVRQHPSAAPNGIVFFDVGLSPYSQKVKMALLEKGLRFEHRRVDLSARDEAFLASNPRGEVPALIEGDLAIFDATIIIEYLDERYPAAPLLPEAVADRARMRMVEEICDSRLEAIIFAVTEIVVFQRADDDLKGLVLAKAKAEVDLILGWLGCILNGRNWFNGNAFGCGDIAVLPYLHLLTVYQLGPPPGSPISEWYHRASARSSFKTCLDDARAEVAAFRQSRERILSGAWPRQYRDHRLDWLMQAGGGKIISDGLTDGSIRLSTLKL